MDIKEHKIFVYGTLLLRSRFIDVINRACEYNIVSIRPAFTEGKMFNKGELFPILIKEKTRQRFKLPGVVYGAIITIEATHNMFNALDSFEGCSMFLSGTNMAYDLYHREKHVATPISYGSMEDFLKMNFTNHDPEEVWMYIGNLKQPKIEHIVTMQTHNPVFWNTLFGIKNWPEYLNI